jgi:hypothetical protein
LDEDSEEEDFLFACPLPERFDWTSDLQQNSWEKTLSWCEILTNTARDHEVDVLFLATVVWWESGGDPRAISSSGAVGLMQVMPRDGIASSFMCINGPCFSGRPTTDELKDPAFNVEYGTSLLVSYIQTEGSLRDGLRRYGPENVGYYYADSILDLYEQVKSN